MMSPDARGITGFYCILKKLENIMFQKRESKFIGTPPNYINMFSAKKNFNFNQVNTLCQCLFFHVYTGDNYAPEIYASCSVLIANICRNIW
jgi:hypothetical protein